MKEKEYLAGWKRAKADLVNYKKEENERLEQAIDRAKTGMIEELLVVIDNLERAEAAVKDKHKKDTVVQGFLQIAQQLRKFLSEKGVKEIQAVGEMFDPSLHEALSTVKSKKHESGKVAKVIEKGYTFKGKLLRATKVQISE